MGLEPVTAKMLARDCILMAVQSAFPMSKERRDRLWRIAEAEGDEEFMEQIRSAARVRDAMHIEAEQSRGQLTERLRRAGL